MHIKKDYVSRPYKMLNLPFFLKKIILFIYLFLSVLGLAARGLSLVVVSGGYSLLRCVASHCSGFSCCRARAFCAQASVVVAHGLSSCGTWAQ